MSQIIITFLLLLPILLQGEGRTYTPWVVYYSDQAKIESFKPFEWVVLDRFTHPPIRALVDQEKKVFGYVTLGEVDDFEPWYEAVQAEGIALEVNKEWTESRLVDLRDIRWGKRVIEEIIPFVLHKGFNGLFLDTIDNAAFLEEKDPKTYQGMKEAAIRLIKAIHYNYPNIPLMLNRGLDIANEVATSISFLVGEDLFSRYDSGKKGYVMTPKKETESNLRAMRAAKKINPALELLSLDYWDPKDRAQIAKIYKMSINAGLSPYVSTLHLDVIVPPPE